MKPELLCVTPDSRHWFYMLAVVPLAFQWLIGDGNEPWLPAITAWHYVLALLASLLFLWAIPFLFGGAREDAKSRLGIFLFTGGIGMLVLHGIHWLAVKSRYYAFDGTIDASFFWHLIRLIDVSNTLVDSEDVSFPVRLFACTVGTGLPEEFVKIIPVCFVLQSRVLADWKDAMIAGLVSGAAFGIAEGIVYSEHRYNGVASIEMYATRFISCVGIHAAWTGIAAILIERKRQAVFVNENVFINIIMILVYISPLMFVHGLYNAFVFSDMPALALLVDLLSVGLLSFIIHRKQAESRATTLRDALWLIRSKIAAGGMDSLSEHEFETLQRARRSPRAAKSRAR